MFIKYDELELFEFFESEPEIIGEYEAGDWMYSYSKDNFMIILLISTYGMYINLSICYNKNIVYSQKHSSISEIRRINPSAIKLIMNENVIIIKKKPQIGVIVEGD